jgi:hypothetical protein
VVDPSLLRQAADRGVTICFADLDGADGLWVPEERTVLVNRGLSESKIAEVIEHELAHVMIDDQHADLDAGREVLVGRPPARPRRLLAAGLTAAGLLAVVGGVTYGITEATGGAKQDQVAPNPDGRGLTASESGQPAPSTTVIPTRLPDGRIEYRTVELTATPPLPRTSGSPAGMPAPTPTATKGVPPPVRSTAAAPRADQPTTSAAQPPVNPSTPPVTPTPDPTTPVPEPTTPVATGGAGDGAGDTGDGGIGGTDGAGGSTVVDATQAVVLDGASGAPVAGPSD